MSMGINLIDSAGKSFDVASFSSNTYDSFVITSGTTGSKSYPELEGYTLYAFTQRITGSAGCTCNYVTVTYPANIPTVTWSVLMTGINGTLTQRVYVMVS